MDGHIVQERTIFITTTVNRAHHMTRLVIRFVVSRLGFMRRALLTVLNR